MVDDRGRSTLERLQRAQHRRPPDHLEVEGAVEPPPHELEDLGKLSGRARRCGHPPSQGRVEVVVSADEAARHARFGEVVRDERYIYRIAHSSVAPAAAPTGTRIGSDDRQRPSRSCRAAATAPAVGTSPISPTPLIP